MCLLYTSSFTPCSLFSSLELALTRLISGELVRGLFFFFYRVRMLFCILASPLLYNKLFCSLISVFIVICVSLCTSYLRSVLCISLYNCCLPSCIIIYARHTNCKVQRFSKQNTITFCTVWNTEENWKARREFIGI